MRISTKLSLAVGASTLLCVGVSGVLGARADVERYEADVRRDQQAMALAISRAIEHVAARDGVERARELVVDLNGRDRNVEIAWLEDVRPSHDEAPETTILRATEDPQMISRFPVHAGGALGTLRLVETLRAERELERTAYLHALATAAAAGLLSTLIMSFLGALLVARPLRALGILARRLGGGDLAARATVARTDEIGALAREMNAMGAQLERAQASVEEASAARVELLEQLRHADRLRVLGEIASEFAHQIGTPLAAVRTRAQLLGQGDVAPDKAKETGRSIVADVDRVSASVRQMLDFARRPTERKEDVDVARCVEGALDVLRPLATSRQIQLEVRRPPAPVRAPVRPIQMQQVVTNLVMNSIQASAAGSRIVVSIGTDAEHVLLTVEDRGGGIAEAELPHVFEPYFTTKSAGEGTGLGLSVAHGIVREHGGNVDVESKVGHGTTVSVRVPRAPTPAPAADGKASWKTRVRSAGGGRA